MSKKYTERETNIVIAWAMIVFGISWLIQWSIQSIGYPRPPYIIDLTFPMVLMAVGAYILKKKINEI